MKKNVAERESVTRKRAVDEDGLHARRLDRVRALLAEHDADAALLSSMPDVRWACGFTGSNGLLLVRPGAAHFVTDGRYREQAAREAQGAAVHVPGYDLIGHLEEERLLGDARRIAFQSDRVSVAALEKWQEALEDRAWVPVKGLLKEIVAIKDEGEVDKIRAAQAITDDVFDHILGVIRPGLSEKDLAAEIVYQHLKRGAERMAFDPIVAGGPNGALPHARASERELQRGELIVLDIGGVRGGYASDMTRTVALGEPGAEARRVYGLVLEAQQAALDAARAGLESKALDAAARDVIEAAGHGDDFGHSLGHGVGLRTHEWPSVSYRRDYALPAGAAVTIEPGVYLPGRFGVRIEDIVVLREGGSENLTRSPKELIVL